MESLNCCIEYSSLLLIRNLFVCCRVNKLTERIQCDVVPKGELLNTSMFAAFPLYSWAEPLMRNYPGSTSNSSY